MRIRKLTDRLQSTHIASSNFFALLRYNISASAVWFGIQRTADAAFVCSHSQKARHTIMIDTVLIKCKI